jgi:hypothetical protein
MKVPERRVGAPVGVEPGDRKVKVRTLPHHHDLPITLHRHIVRVGRNAPPAKVDRGLSVQAERRIQRAGAEQLTGFQCFNPGNGTSRFAQHLAIPLIRLQAKREDRSSKCR